MNTPKVLGCGFHKTATTSLQTALEILGYRVHGFDDRLLHDWSIGETARLWERAEEYEAFRDWPWALIYKEFDRRYPDSKYILTVRDPESWYGSLVRHAQRTGATRARLLVYGFSDPERRKDDAIQTYLRHNREVVEYFGGRNDLLVLDITAGQGWEILCDFLSTPAPVMPFPHALPEL